METVENALTEFLNNGWGKKASRFLKEGATFKVVLDQKSFSLLKQDQKMEMNPGTPESFDVILEISSQAIDFFCTAETENDTRERLRTVIFQPTPDKFFRMQSAIEPKEEERTRFYWKGFYLWAKRIGFVH